MDDAPRFSITDVELLERPVAMRLPFRFGVVTLRQAPQAFVRVTVRTADGREGTGHAAELMVPKWFDKSPGLSNEDNFDQLRRSLWIASGLALAAEEDAAFPRHAALLPAQHAAARADGLNDLVAAFGLALVDRAALDAVARLAGASVFDMVRDNRIALDARLTRDLEGTDLSQILAGLSPAQSVRARHTVGLADALTEAEVAERLDDGLPESLEAAVERWGLTAFKLKVSGNLAADLDRLEAIAAVLDDTAGLYVATLDGNEQFSDAGAVLELWRKMAERPGLERLLQSILFIEQPIHRDRTFLEPVHALADRRPVEIDEAGATLDAFPAARALGYGGISTKACKGFYASLLNRARVEVWNANGEGPEAFMSAEDLTTQAGLAVQQDLALATLVGCGHVERNGHFYVDGFAGAPEAEARAFLAAHPDLYAEEDGRIRLAIRDGAIAVRSLAVPGLASAAEPDFSAMSPMPDPAPEPAEAPRP